MKELPEKGFRAIFMRSVLQIVRRPMYWAGFFLLPLFFLFFLTDEMEDGLPQRVPAAIVDKDGSAISRQIKHADGRPRGGLQQFHAGAP